MPTTNDPTDPRLARGHDTTPREQSAAYLVLTAQERAKGYKRPLRTRYVHRTCGAVTVMGAAIAETFAVEPRFYESTYCARCRQHRPLEEFVWDRSDQAVGT